MVKVIDLEFCRSEEDPKPMISEPSRLLVESQRNSDVFHEGTDQIRVLQTHMSWIFLVGQHAYKIKKPIDLGFADFTTLKNRRHFCQEELRINRRLAPHLYLDVVAITGSCDAPTVGGDGDPIEYAVKMKRFPQSDLLTHVLERGELAAKHVDDLAHDVARFHGRIKVESTHGPFGTPEAVWKPMRANFKHFEQALDGHQTSIRAQHLKDWSEKEYGEKRYTFVARKHGNFIRECHGDMHLGNMVLEQGSVTIFDAIEFNENLRWIDVLSEVAFLVMDLEDRGRPDLAHRFQNRYLEYTGDYHGVVVLPFYVVYRALVRAKVKSIRFRQKQRDEQTRLELQEQFHSYLDLAERYMQPPYPRLLITHGVCGSGKTSGTEPLVDQKGMIRLRSDIERKRLFGYKPLDWTISTIGEGPYSLTATRRTYDRLAELASAVVRAGFSAIVDATFLERRHRDLFRQTARQLGVPFRILEFRASQDTLRERIASRYQKRESASEAGLAVLSHQLQTQQPLANDEHQEVISVDTERFQAADVLGRV
jgi:aminoglycoside phosphotransferase family enzyme/predicted kinase